MKINTKKMTNNELRKAALLILKACEMNMDLTSYGEVGVNEGNGNVYLWVEDYPFTLFIPYGERNIIYSLWMNRDNGDEEQTPVHYKGLDRLIKWCNALDREHEVD